MSFHPWPEGKLRNGHPGTHICDACGKDIHYYVARPTIEISVWGYTQVGMDNRKWNACGIKCYPAVLKDFFEKSSVMLDEALEKEGHEKG